jgi:nicotinamidase-related amidase
MTDTMPDGSDRALFSSAALVLIDLQNDLLISHGSLVEWAEGLVPACTVAVAWARRTGTPVIWVTVERRADYTDVFPHVSDRAPRSRPEPDKRRLVQGTGGAAVVSLLDVRPEDYVVVKTRVSAFHGTQLRSLLTLLDRRTILLGGVYTEMGVEATARAAYDWDLDIVVLSDCCASASAKGHEGSLSGPLKSIAVVRTTADLSAVS